MRDPATRVRRRFPKSQLPNHHLTTHRQPSSKPRPNNPNFPKLFFFTFSVPEMASSYSAQDQAADLGIHRVHNLVLGDSRKEARIAARFSPPQLKRPVLGRGDVRIDEHQYGWETRRELERIARRHNLKAYISPTQRFSRMTRFLLTCGEFEMGGGVGEMF